MTEEVEDRRSLTEVRDRPTEIWIKLLFAITAIAVTLVGYMGDRIITGQDKQLKEMSEINGNLRSYETRITRNEKDIQQLYHNVKRNGE